MRVLGADCEGVCLSILGYVETWQANPVYRIGDSDDFITELWKVHLRVKTEGYVQVCDMELLV